ncbi:BgTH12-04406 [Blumeria graminis f. sp. triticale]|uniref:BgTH12-04406 n=1 Tax=Blumeria graminis f. sp. triticale TaxID=1689686 RepID=A0A9W4CUD1_BLUGR|nr:BgTH12-04406 [Blumeria graminis f. sp. triticale]
MSSPNVKLSYCRV